MQDALRGRRVLVLGGSGFIGRELVRRLDASGADTAAPGRADGADLAIAGAAGRLVEALAPDTVINCAGYGVAKNERAAAGYRRLNAELVTELADALAATGPHEHVRLVHLGSALEYGADHVTLDEADPGRPDTPYGETKAAGTAAVVAARDAGLPALSLRAFTVFGPGERPGRLVPTLLAARQGTDRIPLSEGRQERDLVPVAEVAEALLRAAALEPSELLRARYPFDAGILNLATGKLTSVRAFVERAARVFGIEPSRLGFGDLPGLAEEMFHPPVPVARLEAALGWTPEGDLDAGLTRCVREDSST